MQDATARLRRPGGTKEHPACSPHVGAGRALRAISPAPPPTPAWAHVGHACSSPPPALPGSLHRPRQWGSSSCPLHSPWSSGREAGGCCRGGHAAEPVPTTDQTLPRRGQRGPWQQLMPEDSDGQHLSHGGASVRKPRGQTPNAGSRAWAQQQSHPPRSTCTGKTSAAQPSQQHLHKLPALRTGLSPARRRRRTEAAGALGPGIPQEPRAPQQCPGLGCCQPAACRNTHGNTGPKTTAIPMRSPNHKPLPQPRDTQAALGTPAPGSPVHGYTSQRTHLQVLLPCSSIHKPARPGRGLHPPGPCSRQLASRGALRKAQRAKSNRPGARTHPAPGTGSPEPPHQGCTVAQPSSVHSHLACGKPQGFARRRRSSRAPPL